MSKTNAERALAAEAEVRQEARENAPEGQTPEPKTVKVKLARAHTHAGRALEPGEEIEVSEAQAAWLTKMKVVEE